MNMKSLRGWICLVVFAVACYIIGDNRYLMKAQNATVIAMLIISAGLVFLLRYAGGKGTGVQREDSEDGV